MNTRGLLPRQVPWAEHLLGCLARHRQVVDTSDTGTGKMYVGAALIRELNLPSLVVAPKTILSKWHDVAAYFGTETSAINYEMVRTGRTPYGQWVPSKNGRGRWFQWADEVQFLIFDEAHHCAGMNSQNGGIMFHAKRQNKLMLCTSATLADTPLKMRAIGYVLDLHRGNDFYGWCRRNGCIPGVFGGFEYVGGTKGMVKIHKQIYPARGIRVRIKDIADFPETQITCELVDVTDPAKVDRLYSEMAAQIAALTEKVKQDKSGQSADMIENLRTQQMQELLMVPSVVELAKNAIAEGHSVPIFVSFRETLYEIAKRLGTSCVLHGDISPEERTKNVAAFQRDEERVLVSISSVGGEGLSYQDVRGEFPRYVLALPGYRAETLRQLLGRVRREGGKTKSYQRILFPATKLGREIHRRVSEKLDNLDALNDSDLNPQNLQLT